MNGCDYGHETNGETRRLPTSKPDAMGSTSAVIVCKAHYFGEMAYRRERNKTLETFAKFDFPAWGKLQIIEGAK